MKKSVRLVAALVVVLASIGCTSSVFQSHTPLNQSADYYDYIQPTFSDYISTTEVWLTENRTYITDDHDREIVMNMPSEAFPAQPTGKAILLVHGLGDSPYSYSDLAVTLQDQGFYVQNLLLPGHGSKPEDLMLPVYQDWQTIVDHYANLIKQDYQEVWLGGFSTGGNLVTIHAIEQGGIDGLMLFSPGFQSRTPFLEKLASLASLFIDGYTAEETNIVRYTSAPIKGAIAYSDSAARLRELLRKNRVEVPTLIAISEADSIIDPDAVKSLYQERFNNPHNKLIWYGESESDSPAIDAMTMHIDKFRVSTGSHMSPVFSPSNPYYGRQGEHIMCMNSFDDEAIARCDRGEEIWFSAWGYEEEGKIHARLTWNPYYLELEESIRTITQAGMYTGN